MMTRISFFLLAMTLSLGSGCSFLAKLGRPKYRAFPAGKPASRLAVHEPAAARLFRDKFGHRMTLRRVAIASNRWSLVRHRRSGRILRRAAQVWMGWEHGKGAGDCRLGLYWIYQSRLGPGRWTDVILGRQVYGRSRYIGGQIPCGRLTSAHSRPSARSHRTD